jgi:hypothetical protein
MIEYFCPNCHNRRKYEKRLAMLQCGCGYEMVDIEEVKKDGRKLQRESNM